MPDIGQQVFFKRENDKRLLKGLIIGVNDTGWIVRGCRTARNIKPPIHTLQDHEIHVDYIPEKLRPRKYETGHGGCGMSVLASESIRRKQIVENRLLMTESQILQARAMLEIRRRAVRSLAGTNRIAASRQDFDFQELDCEYIAAQLMALRSTAATATPEDIREFKQFLNGEVTDSRMMLTVCRTARTVAIRHLKKRQFYYDTHRDISTYDFPSMGSEIVYRRDVYEKNTEAGAAGVVRG